MIQGTIHYTIPQGLTIVNGRVMTKTAKQTKWPICRLTFNDAPANLMILCVLEDKAKNYARQFVTEHIKPSAFYASNARVKAYADMVLDIARRHDKSFCDRLPFDEQCRFADLCQHYDDYLDGIINGMQQAINDRTLACPKELRGLWSHAVAAGYSSLVAVILQNVLRDGYGCIFSLYGCVVDSIAFKYMAEKCDAIVTEIWGGEVNLATNKLYDALDTEFCQKLTNPEFFCKAAHESGFTQYNIDNLTPNN